MCVVNIYADLLITLIIIHCVLTARHTEGTEDIVKNRASDIYV